MKKNLTVYYCKKMSLYSPHPMDSEEPNNDLSASTFLSKVKAWAISKINDETKRREHKEALMMEPARVQLKKLLNSFFDEFKKNLNHNLCQVPKNRKELKYVIWMTSSKPVSFNGTSDYSTEEYGVFLKKYIESEGYLYSTEQIHILCGGNKQDNKNKICIYMDPSSFSKKE